MKFTSFYTTANNANALSPFAKEGADHFFYQQDYDSGQQDVAEEEKPLTNETGNTNSPWSGTPLYGNDIEQEENPLTSEEGKSSSGNNFFEGSNDPLAVDLQSHARGAKSIMASDQGNRKEAPGTDLPGHKQAPLSLNENLSAFQKNKADFAGAANTKDLLSNTSIGLNGIEPGPATEGPETTASANPLETATDKASLQNPLETSSPNPLVNGKAALQNPLSGSMDKVVGSVPGAAALPIGKDNAVPGGPIATPEKSPATQTAAEGGQQETATPSTENGGGTNPEAVAGPGAATTPLDPTAASQSNGDSPATESAFGNSTELTSNLQPAPGNESMERIDAGRDADFKPTIQNQAGIIQADADITQQEIIQLANERRSQVYGLFAGSRANVTAAIEGNALLVQEVIMAQQTAVMSVAVEAIANIQALIGSATANAQSLVQSYQVAIGSVVANATQTVQEGITGVASEITGLINSVNLPDLPGLQTARSMVVGLINSGAAAVNSTLTGMLSMIGSMLQFGLGLLSGFIGIFGQMLGQAFLLVSNGIMTMLNLLISAFNAIMGVVISSLQNLLYSIILPLLLQIEGLVIGQINTSEQEHLQQVAANRDSHLEMLANILDPEGASGGASGSGSGGSDPGWTIEKIGLSATTNDQKLRNNFTKVVNLIFGNIVADITVTVTRVITEIDMRVNQFIGALIRMVTQLVQLIYMLVAAVIQFLTMIITELMNVLNGLLNFITNAITNPVTAAINAARGVLNRVRSAISNIVDSFLNGIGLGSSPGVSAPAVSPFYAGGPTPAFAGGPIIIIGGKVIIIIGTAFFIISTTVAIIILVVLVIILLILLYLLYKWLTKPAPPPPPPPPPPPRGNEYSPGTPLVQEHAIPRRQRDIQVSKGEKMLFGFVGNDTDQVRPIGTPAWTDIPGPGPYEIDWEVNGDADLFEADSGIKGFTDPSKRSINLEVFVSSAWTGTPLSITATFRDNALPAAPPDIGTTKDATDFKVEWTLKQRVNPCPTSLKRVAGADGTTWVKAPALYTYQGMPHLGPPGTPSYEGQTFLESFTTPTALNFTMDDLKPDWKAANPTLNTPDKVAGFLWNSGFNSTFVFNNKDQASDQHSGFGTTKPFLQSALDRPDGIGYRLPQIYSCDSNTFGTADIDRRISTANGIEVKKNGPS